MTAPASIAYRPTEFAVESLRAQFPILRTLSRGKPLVYLDSAATSQKPECVLDAMDRFYRTSNSNIHRGVYQLSERATALWDEARATVARFIGAEPEEVIFVRGTTEAINLLAHTLVARGARQTPRVLVTGIEHHANIVPWQLAGATTVPVTMLDSGELDLDAAASLLGTAPQIFAFTHASNVLGTVLPVAELSALARANGVISVVDGAQAVPHLPIDVRSMSCDCYCFSGHKAFGPTGIGVLWVRRELLDRMPPWQGGGDMIERVTFEGTTYAQAPRRFEAGTPNIAGAVGLAAALEWLNGIDRSAVSRHETSLLEHTLEGLAAVPQVRALPAPSNRVPAVSFTVDGGHPHDVASLLDQDGICVRAGHHCAQPVHRHLGINASVRVSFGPYNTHDEVDHFLQSLSRVIGILT